MRVPPPVPWLPRPTSHCCPRPAQAEPSRLPSPRQPASRCRPLEMPSRRPRLAPSPSLCARLGRGNGGVLGGQLARVDLEDLDRRLGGSLSRFTSGRDLSSAQP